MNDRSEQPLIRIIQDLEAERDALKAQVKELTEVLQVVRGPMPDAMHPQFSKMPKLVDWLICSQIVIDDALGEEDPGNVEAARSWLEDR